MTELSKPGEYISENIDQDLKDALNVFFLTLRSTIKPKDSRTSITILQTEELFSLLIPLQVTLRKNKQKLISELSNRKSVLLWVSFLEKEMNKYVDRNIVDSVQMKSVITQFTLKFLTSIVEETEITL